MFDLMLMAIMKWIVFCNDSGKFYHLAAPLLIKIVSLRLCISIPQLHHKMH